MGYTTDFVGQLDFSRELTVKEYKDLKQMNDDPSVCNQFTDTPETVPSSYMQWVSNDDGTGLVWDGNEKFYDYIHWLRWLVKHFFKPRGIELNGTIQWRGEEFDDVGVITAEESKITTKKLEVKNQVECPNCGERFVADEE